jgi:hypothetical protein
MRSCSFAVLAGLAVTLAAASVGAQPVNQGPAVPGATPSALPPPSAYGGAPFTMGPQASAYPPPGYFMPFPPPLAPYTPMKRQSSKMIAAGIVLLSVGSVGLIAGPALYAAGAKDNFVFPPCTPDGFCPDPTSSKDSGLVAAGITSIVLGGLAVVAGIPVLVIGAKKVPDTGTAFVPELRASPGGGALAWTF